MGTRKGGFSWKLVNSKWLKENSWWLIPAFLLLGFGTVLTVQNGDGFFFSKPSVSSTTTETYSTTSKANQPEKIVEREIVSTEPGRTLWDFLGLIGVPILIVLLGNLIRHQQQRQAELTAAAQQVIADSQARADILESYFGQLSSLLIDKNLLAIATKVDSGKANPEQQDLLDAARNVIRAITLSTLRRLQDSDEHQGSIIRCLVESEIIGKVKLSLREIALSGADLKEINLSSADLKYANLSGAKCNRAKLDNANLGNANLRGAVLAYASMSSAYLRFADLRDADLICTDLRFSILGSANLSSADLRSARLGFANLSSANLRNADLGDADLRNADLLIAKLNNTNLRNADLRYARLQLAKISGANLSGANLSGADLSEAALRSTNLSGANLSGANLSGADFSGSDLSNADFRQADLSSGCVYQSNSYVCNYARSVVGARFSNVQYFTEDYKKNLEKRGAIFEDMPVVCL
ncbi:MAG: pentapeptide repeat-containing protein [Leptolyngbyaceae cyanobacterium]